jgi:hypothetical protein
MNPAALSANVVRAILASGSACFILDGIAAMTLFALKGVKPHRVWQGVAGALLGPGSFDRGNFAVALGVFLHFLVAFTAAAVFVLASRHVPWLIDHAIPAGMMYGVAVWVVMNFVVIPLSAMPKRPFNLTLAASQLLIHIFIVGLSISLPARHFLR